MIKPMVRGGVCLNAHPEGCRQEVLNQIDYVRRQGEFRGPKNVLVLGASGGYGLASRIALAFGCGANTLGVSFERMPTEKKPGTPGFYNSRAFDEAASKENFVSKTMFGDAFSFELKDEVIAALKKDFGPVDLVIYSLATGIRPHPVDGVTYRSALKPIGEPFRAKAIDFMTGKISQIELEPASEEEIESTVKVMGGEDWEMWIDALSKADILAPDAKTLAYSYIGPEVTHPIYWDGTIGKAKEDLDRTAARLTEKLQGGGGAAYVSVNKALVTRASAVIPTVPLYISLLFKVMKEKNLHEGCIEQMYRLYGQKIYESETISTDDEGRIRVDDWEMRDDVQAEVSQLWDRVDENSPETLGDLEGYRQDFLRLHGFNVPGVDYKADVSYL